VLIKYIDVLDDEEVWRWTASFHHISAESKKGWSHPNSLRPSFWEPGAPLPRETISLIEDVFVTRIKHTIIAVGKWEAEKESKLRQTEIRTVWLRRKTGTPDKSLFGSHVNHVRVSTRKKLLFLDANSMLPPRMRKSENVRAYLPANWKEDIDPRSRAGSGSSG
jgi:hypothetical protein